jgi:pimeloyl-ACP methyl ester carboxylesterase
MLLKYWLRQSAAYARACWTHSRLQAELLRNMTTRDWALDMDSIRQALGVKQITYYGYSYGTYLGQVYATLFPSHLRRLILDSNVDPRSVWYESNLQQDVPFNRNLNLWFVWLAKHNNVFGLGTSAQAISQLFYATEQQLQKHPAGGQVGPDEWVDAFIDAGYWNQDWPSLGQAFSAWVHKPNNAAAKTLIGLYRGADTPGNDNTFAAYLAVECSDASWPRSWSRWNRDNSAINRQAPFETWSNAWFNAPCIYWRYHSHPVPINGSHIRNALLVDETLDAATPFEGSLEVRKLFPHAVLLAEPGGTSHADSLSGDLCVDRTVAHYLANGTLPKRKTHAKWDKTCAPLKPPPASPSPAVDVARAVVSHMWGGRP